MGRILFWVVKSRVYIIIKVEVDVLVYIGYKGRRKRKLCFRVIL